MTLRKRALAAGNRKVASLEELKQIPTKGYGDSPEGQFVVVSEVNYSELVGATNYTLLDDADYWDAPSDGMVHLDGVSQSLSATWDISEQSLVSTVGNTFSVWFKLDQLNPCTVLHLSTKTYLTLTVQEDFTLVSATL